MNECVKKRGKRSACGGGVDIDREVEGVERSEEVVGRWRDGGLDIWRRRVR